MSNTPCQAGVAVVRPFTRADAGEVGRLFLDVFRQVDAVPGARLEKIFTDSFLNEDGSSFSRVYVCASGKIIGFVGALPQQFVVQGRMVSALVVGSLMVKDHEQNPLAGARLLRSLTEAGVDIVVSETANPISQKMWEKSGGIVISGYSLDYFRVLRPFGFMLDMACLKIEALRFLAPAMRGLDWLTTRFFRYSGQISRKFYERDLSPQELGVLMPAFAQHYALYPDFDVGQWQKRIDAALLKEKYGNCVIRGVFNRKQECVGIYVFHGMRDKTAHVLQILAQPAYINEVTHGLFASAQRIGAVAVRGRSVPDIQAALASHKSLFVQRSSLTLYTQDAAVIDAFQRGQALTTGLAGETWIGLIGCAHD